MINVNPSRLSSILYTMDITLNLVVSRGGFRAIGFLKSPHGLGVFGFRVRGTLRICGVGFCSTRQLKT